MKKSIIDILHQFPETWTREQKVHWVAFKHIAIDTLYAEWCEKEFHGDKMAEFLSNKELPADIREMLDEYHKYPANIRKAAVLLLKYYEEIKLAANAHELRYLRILLDGENIFYEDISADEMEAKFEDLKAKAHDAQQGIADTDIA